MHMERLHSENVTGKYVFFYKHPKDINKLSKTNSYTELR